jgi:hypothetical protein
MVLSQKKKANGSFQRVESPMKYSRIMK